MNSTQKRLKPHPTSSPTRRRAGLALRTPRKNKTSQASVLESLVQKRKETVRDIESQLGKQLSPDLEDRLSSALDSGDQSILDLANSIDFSLLEMKNKTLKDIEEAILRLKEKSDGTCEECGHRIPEGRLKAMPFARTCVRCQEERELIEKIERKEDELH